MVSGKCEIRPGVLITGSSQGLGRYLAFVFAENNWDVVLHGRNGIRLEEVCREISKFQVSHEVVIGDLRDTATLNELYSLARDRNISVLVNNAAVICPSLPLNELSDKTIDEMIETNLIAPIKLCQRIYPIFAERGNGVIININSLVGQEPKKLRSLYTASKWGLRGFSESLKLEAEKYGVSVASVYMSKIRLTEEDEFGMDPWEVARKIYKVYENPRDITIDGRPPEFRLK